MPYYDDSGRRIHRPIRRRPNDGVVPPDKKTRKLIQDTKERHKKYTPAEIKAVLDNDGHKISLNVIIGVLKGK